MAALTRILCCSIALLASCPAWAQGAYKCVDEKGRVTLQQAPCTGGQPLKLGGNSFGGEKPPPGKEEIGATDAAAKLQLAIDAGLLQGNPVVGMNTEQLAQVLGQPDRVNTSDYGRGLEEQRVYERDERTLNVYTANGLVRAVESTARVGGAPRRSGPCPSATAIRNAYVSASSIKLGEAERATLLQRAKDMEACQ